VAVGDDVTDGVASGAPRADGEPLGDAVLSSVLRALPDGVVVLDHLAQIQWINDRFVELLGWTLDDLRGRNGLDLIDPVQQLDAIEALTIVRESPNAIPPGAYRLLHRDGRLVPLEMHGASLDPSDASSPTVLLARPVDYQTLMVDGLELLNADAPIEDMASYIVRGIGWPSGAVALVFDDDVSGERRSVHPDLPDVLDGTRKAEDGEAPWEVVEATGEPFQCNVDALPPSLRGAAQELGFVSCSVDTIPDPQGRDALVILWFREGAPLTYRFLFKEEPRYLLFRLALERRAYHAVLYTAATQDHLTGLANRARFFETIEAPRQPTDGACAVLYIDLDDFKPVNDVHGHLAGDAVLAEVGRRISTIVRPSDLVARIGGDEFAVFCAEVAGEEAVEALARRIHDVIVLPIPLAVGEPSSVSTASTAGRDSGSRRSDFVGTSVRVGASIGAAVAADDRTDARDLVGAADEVLYELKRAGKDGWRVRTLHSAERGEPREGLQ
jgi:diguanylate cyclase (GGDEF)-like protein/PAS domain S-box-containing protein